MNVGRYKSRAEILIYETGIIKIELIRLKLCRAPSIVIQRYTYLLQNYQRSFNKIYCRQRKELALRNDLQRWCSKNKSGLKILLETLLKLLNFEPKETVRYA